MVSIAKFNVGDRVALNAVALLLRYVVCRAAYTDVCVGKKGTVIGYAETGKVAVQFDEPIFTQQYLRRSSHNNGCHGKGKINYCWYFPESCLELVITDCCINTTNDSLLLL